MAEIHDLEAERDRREVEKLLMDAKNFKGFDTDLDLCEMPVHFTGHCMGPGGTDDDRLRIIVYMTPLAPMYDLSEQSASDATSGSK